jgi:hypothetical protein
MALPRRSASVNIDDLMVAPRIVVRTARLFQAGVGRLSL